MVNINNVIKEAEKEAGSNFKELFSEEQQKEIIEMMERLDKKIGGK